MIFQLRELIGDVILVIMLTMIIVAVIAFLLGIIITRWLASKKDWSDSWGKAFIVNLVWLIVLIVVGVGLSFVALDPLISYVLALIINLIVGAIIVAKIYDKGFVSSLIFVIIVLIILFIIMIIVFIVVAIIVASIILGS